MRASFIYSGVVLSVLCFGACSGSSDDGGSGASDDGGGGAVDLDGSDGVDGAGTHADGGNQGDSGSSPGKDSGGPPIGSGSLTPGDSTLTIMAGGKARSVLLHVPAAVTGHELPLVIALHGDGDTNANFVTGTTQLEAKSDALGFVLAAPQGITRNIVVGAQTVPNVDWDPYNDVPANIDLPLLDAIDAQLVATGSIDSKNVLVYGYSQGGFLSFRWGMDASAKLSCAAVLAAGDPFGGSRPTLVTGAARKIPVSIQIGKNDSLLPQAQTAKNELTANGNPLDYHEITGAGHVPVPGDFAAPLTYCLSQHLP